MFIKVFLKTTLAAVHIKKCFYPVLAIKLYKSGPGEAFVI